MTERATGDERTTATLEAIDVLLVDGDERWATGVAEELERREPDLRIESALGANEALAVVHEASIDCLVVDYRLPETDGIELVERIRDERPELPIVLVAGEDAEAVAARAIDAGVTDYLQKDPTVDQTPILAGKIRTAVERRALRRAVEDGRRRYRTMVERSHEAIVLLREERIRFCNGRFAELAGSTVEELVGAEFVETFVHESDRGRFREVDGDHLSKGVHDVRLRLDDDRVAHCEYTGGPIVDDGEAATMLSIRDVTERRLAELRRRRERDLSRRVQRAIVAAGSRKELERAVVAALAEGGYELVWFGLVAESRLEPRVVAGDRRYVDDVELSLDRTERECEPSVWAARTGTTQAVSDFEALVPTDWRNLALEHGFRTGIALPVGYEDVTVGVLAAYSDDPGSIDDAEREFLGELAATVGYAIHHADVRRALTADHGLEARIELRGGAHYLSGIVAAVGGASSVAAVVRGTHADGAGTVVQYVTVPEEAAPRFRDAAAGHPAVRDIVPVGTADDSFQVTVEGPTPESALAPFSALVRSTRAVADRSVLRIELPSRRNLNALIAHLEDRYGRVSLLSCVEREWTAGGDRLPVDASALTEKQATALEAAYRHGYFERPRRSSATEIATALGVSHSTYLQHLRAAQQKVLSERYDR